MPDGSWTTAHRGPHAAATIAAAALTLTLLPALARSPAAAASCPASLQAFVDAAPAGATVTVPPCTYHEAVVIRKPITLLAAGAVIDGDNTRPRGISVTDVDDVTIDGLTVQRVKNDWHVGGVNTWGADRFTFRNGISRANATVGIAVGGSSGVVIEGSEFADNGQQGYFINQMSNVRFDRNRVHGSNPDLAFSYGEEAGGGKVHASANVSFDGNEIWSNRGPGIWYDNGCTGAVVTGNRLHGNDREGIFFEISSGATVTGNAVWGNGFGYPGWGWGAGIGIASSDGALVRDNVVAWNAHGISVISQGRGPWPHDHNTVTGNVVIAAGDNRLAGWYDDGDDTLFAPVNANTGSGNRYWSDTAERSSCRFEWWGCVATLAAFNATPGEEGARYLSTSERDAQLRAANVPLSPGGPLPSPMPTAAPPPTATAGPTTAPTAPPTAAPTAAPTPPSSSAAPTPTASAAPPTVARPTIRVRTGLRLPRSSIPIRLTWSRAAGAIRYQLQAAGSDGDWADIAPVSSGSRTADFAVAAASATRIRLRAGNADAWGPWSATTVTPGRYQETNPAATWFGSWLRRASANASGGFVRASSARSARARFAFRGRAFAWVAPVGPTRGSAAVYVDGAKAGTIDLRRSVAGSQRIVFARSWPTTGQHVVTIVVAGSGARARVDVDAFVTLR